MDIHFVPPDLRRLDKLRSEALALSFFEDERPLHGTLGLVDWRLCGMVSELIHRGRIRGEVDECLLLPPRPRLPFDKLFVFGLGPQAQFDLDRFERVVRATLDVLARSRVRAPAIALPGRGFDAIEAGRAMECFLEMTLHAPESHDEVTLVEHPDAQRAVGPLVEHARRRHRAAVE